MNSEQVDTSSSTRPSDIVLLQRVRNHLIDYLSLAASFEQQLKLQEQSSQLQVSEEVIEQWADWVGPEWLLQFISPVFSAEEIELMQ